MITHEKTLFWLVGNPDLRRMEDLIGKTVAVDRLATLQDIVARGLVRRKGVNPEQVTFITDRLGVEQRAVALLSLPHNFVMTQKGYRELASALEIQPALRLGRDRHP